MSVFASSQVVVPALRRHTSLALTHGKVLWKLWLLTSTGVPGAIQLVMLPPLIGIAAMEYAFFGTYFPARWLPWMALSSYPMDILMKTAFVVWTAIVWEKDNALYWKKTRGSSKTPAI